MASSNSEPTTESESEETVGMPGQKRVAFPDSLDNSEPSSAPYHDYDDVLSGNIPDDLVADTMSGNFKYITRNPIFQEYELSARTALVNSHKEAAMAANNYRTKMKTAMIKISRQFKDLTVGEVMDEIGEFDSLEEFVENITNYLETYEGDDEEDDDEEEENDIRSVSAAASARPPLPPRKLTKDSGVSVAASSASATTASTSSAANDVYQFVGNDNDNNISSESSEKIPRALKPGEVLYSRNLSPIFVNSGSLAPPQTPPTKILERLQIGDGSKKLEVDVILRSEQGTEELELFKEFVSQARTCATTVKQNRVQPPRIQPKTVSRIQKKPIYSSTDSVKSTASVRGNLMTPATATKKKVTKKEEPTPATSVRGKRAIKTPKKWNY